MTYSKGTLICGALGLALIWYLFRSSPTPADQELVTNGATMGSTPIDSQFYQVLGRRVHALEVNRANKGTTIVLLHGQAFSAEVWREIGTLAELDKRGICAIAIDLPGHGVTGGQTLPSEERGAFLAELMRQLRVGAPAILITPSMSGSYALPYLSQHVADLAAWVPIAPVGLREWVDSGTLPSEGDRKKLKVVAIYGEHDRMRDDYRFIEDAFPTTAQFVLIRDARHACYKDQPKVFHRELLRFLDNEI